MTKYFRVKEDTFLWKKGAIISNENDDCQYLALFNAGGGRIYDIIMII